MNRKIIIPAILIIVAVTLGARSWFTRSTAVEASGTLEARNVNVGSKVGGRVAKVLVAEGDRVQAGQVLVTFEDSELEARLLQARGSYEQAKANYEKMSHGSRSEDIAEAKATHNYQEHNADVYRADVERARADAVN